MSRITSELTWLPKDNFWFWIHRHGKWSEVQIYFWMAEIGYSLRRIFVNKSSIILELSLYFLGVRTMQNKQHIKKKPGHCLKYKAHESKVHVSLIFWEEFIYHCFLCFYDIESSFQFLTDMTLCLLPSFYFLTNFYIAHRDTIMTNELWFLANRWDWTKYVHFSHTHTYKKNLWCSKT